MAQKLHAEVSKRAKECAEGWYKEQELLEWLNRERMPIPQTRQALATFLCEHFRLAYQKGFHHGHSD